MATVKINGMRCPHCSSAVTKALENIDGIGNVKVDLEQGEATYTETHPVPLAAIKEAISKIGFEVA
ncbi:MAG: heavy-metal-associated domain-containing protein [Deltaproteobacteria bacterium]|nr:heavy-metal-associated domain-containing protein [Deltaproteobacteria bacterium]